VGVNFVKIKAYQNERIINVEWDVENELNTAVYQVERSANGYDFNNIGTIQPKINNGGNENYRWPDLHPLSLTNFYRIKNIALDGSIQYSKIVKVIDAVQQGIELYSNPVTDGIIQLHFNQMPEGVYTVQMFTITGQLLMSKQLQHRMNNTRESVKPGNQVAHGNYQLVISGPNSIKVVRKIFF